MVTETQGSDSTKSTAQVTPELPYTTVKQVGRSLEMMLKSAGVLYDRVTALGDELYDGASSETDTSLPFVTSASNTASFSSTSSLGDAFRSAFSDVFRKSSSNFAFASSSKPEPAAPPSSKPASAASCDTPLVASVVVPADAKYVVDDPAVFTERDIATAIVEATADAKPVDAFAISVADAATLANAADTTANIITANVNDVNATAGAAVSANVSVTKDDAPNSNPLVLAATTSNDSIKSTPNVTVSATLVPTLGVTANDVVNAKSTTVATLPDFVSVYPRLVNDDRFGVDASFTAPNASRSLPKSLPRNSGNAENTGDISLTFPRIPDEWLQLLEYAEKYRAYWVWGFAKVTNDALASLRAVGYKLRLLPLDAKLGQFGAVRLGPIQFCTDHNTTNGHATSSNLASVSQQTQESREACVRFTFFFIATRPLALSLDVSRALLLFRALSYLVQPELHYISRGLNSAASNAAACVGITSSNAPVTRSIIAPITTLFSAPVTAPVTALITAPVTVAITAPITAPIATAITAPITAPVTPPVTTTATVAITDPVTAPVTTLTAAVPVTTLTAVVPVTTLTAAVPVTAPTTAHVTASIAADSSVAVAAVPARCPPFVANSLTQSTHASAFGGIEANDGAAQVGEKLAQTLVPALVGETKRSRIPSSPAEQLLIECHDQLELAERCEMAGEPNAAERTRERLVSKIQSAFAGNSSFGSSELSNRLRLRAMLAGMQKLGF